VRESIFRNSALLQSAKRSRSAMRICGADSMKLFSRLRLNDSRSSIAALSVNGINIFYQSFKQILTITAGEG